jgi:hypothetical protein
MFRLYGCACCVLIACGGGKNAAPDGGATSDAEIDAISIDAPTDAPSCAGPDHDGDGVCDTVDLCPDVADPGQADLDGDHIGWMCDPIESVILAGDGTPAFVQTSIHENTFAARTKIQCQGATMCGHALLQVGAAGALITRSDSTAPVDAWQASANAAWLDGPLVTPDNRVLWSRGHATGDIGDFDLATHTFTSRASGVLNPDDDHLYAAVYRGTELEAVALSTAPDMLTQNLVDVRADGSLATLATAQGFTNATSGSPLSIPGPTVRAFVPVRTQFQVGLKVYTRGETSLADVVAGGAPLTALGTLETLVVDGQPRGFCASRGTQRFAVGWDKTGTIETYQLPISSCLGVAATDRGDARIFFNKSSDTLIGYSFGGAFHPLAANGPNAYVGDKLPVLITTFTQVFEIAEDGTSSLVSSTGDTPIVSMSGDTIHVLFHSPDPNDPQSAGIWQLARYRAGQAQGTVTIISDVPNGIDIGMVTTVEGAALIYAESMSVIVPSQSMTLVPSPVGRLTGGIRDGRTVVFSKGNLGDGALYLYSEIAGAPQLTMIDAAGGAMSGYMIDVGPTKSPTSWFTYSNATTGCRIARIAAGDTVESVPCDLDYAVHVLGTRADGALVVGDGSSMFALSTAGAVRIGTSSGLAYDEAILDTSSFTPVVVGWSAASGVSKRFSCLAMHPERCWDYPNDSVFIHKTTASATANNGDGSFQHVLMQWPGPGSAKLTIVRSIGPGTFTP